jgi:hypothetical protein
MGAKFARARHVLSKIVPISSYCQVAPWPLETVLIAENEKIPCLVREYVNE